MPQDPNNPNRMIIDAAKRQIGISVSVPDVSKGESAVESNCMLSTKDMDPAMVQWNLILTGIHSLLESEDFQKQMLVAGCRARGGEEAAQKAMEHIGTSGTAPSGKAEDFKPTTTGDALGMIMSARPDPKKMN